MQHASCPRRPIQTSLKYRTTRFKAQILGRGPRGGAGCRLQAEPSANGPAIQTQRGPIHRLRGAAIAEVDSRRPDTQSKRPSEAPVCQPRCTGVPGSAYDTLYRLNAPWRCMQVASGVNSQRPGIQCRRPTEAPPCQPSCTAATRSAEWHPAAERATVAQGSSCTRLRQSPTEIQSKRPSKPTTCQPPCATTTGSASRNRAVERAAGVQGARHGRRSMQCQTKLASIFGQRLTGAAYQRTRKAHNVG